jgi:hypothetical protein
MSAAPVKAVLPRQRQRLRLRSPMMLDDDHRDPGGYGGMQRF